MKFGPAWNLLLPSGSLFLTTSDPNLNFLQTYKDALNKGDLIYAIAKSVLVL